MLVLQLVHQGNINANGVPVACVSATKRRENVMWIRKYMSLCHAYRSSIVNDGNMSKSVVSNELLLASLETKAKRH